MTKQQRWLPNNGNDNGDKQLNQPRLSVVSAGCAPYAVSFEADTDVASFLRRFSGDGLVRVLNNAVRAYAETALGKQALPKRLLSTRETAAEFGVPEATLETMRTRGGGPSFRKFGKTVKYDRFEVEAWIAEHPSRKSTSDQGRTG